ncbi:MAG TPA: DUF1269 domain-containing protein [Anaerolineae bacterium]|nr:DUF1269 domain-containing protein [Anaerolineae bacterium]
MMKHIPLHARVECSDGVCGESTHIVGDPIAGRLTYVVVREKHGSQKERLVPLERVAKTTSKLIQLDCSAEELAAMELFSTQQLIELPPSESSEASFVLPYAILDAGPVLVEYEHIPPGQLSVRRGTGVEATDGWIGRVDELAIDPKSGEITHLLLGEGHLWGKKEVVLPVSAIDRIFDEVVYLKLDKQTIEKLPAIPVRRSFGWPEAEIELVVVVFDKPDGAKEALKLLKQLKREKKIVALRNAAVLVRDEQGQTSLSEMQDVDAKHGAIFGAITGGLMGLVAGPVGAIVGAAAGAATGRATAKRVDMGFSNQYLRDVQDKLQPGSSALVALVEHEGASSVVEVLSDFVGGQLFRQALPDEIVAELIGNAGEHPDD